MKKVIVKTLAVCFSAAVCLSVLAGCGGSADYPQEAPESEEYLETGYYDEIPEDFTDFGENGEWMEGTEWLEETGAFATEPINQAAGGTAGAAAEPAPGPAPEPAPEPAAEPAEGLSDQVLMEGYYGQKKGDTIYKLGVLKDNHFIIDVVGASAPVLYGEGTYKDNNDGTYTATITSADQAFANNQVISIKAEGGPDISLTSDNAEVKAAVEGQKERIKRKCYIYHISKIRKKVIVFVL